MGAFGTTGPPIWSRSLLLPDEGDEEPVSLGVTRAPVAQLLDQRILLDVDDVDEVDGPDECPQGERPQG